MLYLWGYEISYKLTIVMNVTQELLLQVWRKAKVEPGFDENMFRKDACGAWIVWDKYGVQDNMYGWEIDHIWPEALLKLKGVSQDMIDDLANLRPLQHQNNAAKGDDYPSYTAVVTAEGNKNILKEQSLVVNEKVRTLLESKLFA